MQVHGSERSLAGKVIVTSLLALLIMLVVLPVKMARTSATSELGEIRSALGPTIGVKIQSHASMSARWLYQEVNQVYRRDLMRTDWGRDRIDVVYWLTYLAVERFFAVVFVGMLVAPFVVAAFVDGLVARAKKKAQLEYVNKVRYDLGFHLAHVTLLLPLVMFIIPLPVPTWGFAIWWILLASGVHLVTHHLHHRL